MTSVRLKFRPSTVKGREGYLIYQVIHDRITRTVRSGWHIYPEEWDYVQNRIITPDFESPRYRLITEARMEIRRDMERFNTVIDKLQRQGIEYCVHDVIEWFYHVKNNHTLFRFIKSQIKELKEEGRNRTAETYASTLVSFRSFRKGTDIMLDTIDSTVIDNYGAWLRSRGLVPNTISFYARVLRAIYNKAVEQELITDLRPFRHIYTGIPKTRKRATDIKTLAILRRLDLSGNPRLDFARDMFLLSFYLRGMSFIDMAFLRKSDLSNGYLFYYRHKTKQTLTVRWTQEMQDIVNKHPSENSPYLLPIINRRGSQERKSYLAVSRRINYSLKIISRMAEIPGCLTMYVARHTWATAARKKGIPIAVITQGLGHTNESTTQVYLSDIENTELDKANELLISSV